MIWSSKRLEPIQWAKWTCSMLVNSIGCVKAIDWDNAMCTLTTDSCKNRADSLEATRSIYCRVFAVFQASPWQQHGLQSLGLPTVPY